MTSKIVVHKGRTNTLTVDMGIDVTGDIITSEIRSEANYDSPLLAVWTVTNTPGKPNELILTLDDNETRQIKVNSGYMDIKRVTGSEPVPVFDRPLEVSFRGTVTL